MSRSLCDTRFIGTTGGESGEVTFPRLRPTPLGNVVRGERKKKKKQKKGGGREKKKRAKENAERAVRRSLRGNAFTFYQERAFAALSLLSSHRRCKLGKVETSIAVCRTRYDD